MRDSMRVLASTIHCEAPPVGLTDERLFALHEFFHVVLAASYKLIQVVPRENAAQVIKQKFDIFCRRIGWQGSRRRLAPARAWVPSPGAACQ